MVIWGLIMWVQIFQVRQLLRDNINNIFDFIEGEGRNFMSAGFLQKSSKKDEWNSFVDKSPQGSVFCYYEWLKFSTYDDFEILVYVENNDIIGGMPLPFYSTNKIKLPALTQKMGVLFQDFSHLKYTIKLGKEKKIIYSFLDILEANKISYNMNFDWHFDNWLPFYWRGYEQTSRYTYIIDFNEKNCDLIWQDMDQHKRKSIRKAQKNHLNIYETDDIKEFYNFNKNTFKRQNLKIPYSFNYLENLYNSFKENTKIYKAIDCNKNVHAINFYIRDNKSVYYLMSGFDPNYRASGAQDFIQWEAINYYCDKVKYFDFEGSMIESIESNFRKFGAVQKQYFRICKKNIMNKIKDIVKIIFNI